MCATGDSQGSIHPFRERASERARTRARATLLYFPTTPQDLRRAGRRGTPRGRTGRYVYCSKLSLLARVAAASHRVIFIIRPFVFAAAARPESNNSARRRPRERFSFSKSLSPSLLSLPVRFLLCRSQSSSYSRPPPRSTSTLRLFYLFRASLLSG